MSERPTNAWLWPAADGLNGLNIDLESGRFEWFDAIGCACSESFARQTATEFRRAGPPGGISAIPGDVLVEIETAVAYVEQRLATGQG